MSENENPTVERHPFRYPWRERFPEARQVAGCKGGAVYEAEGENAYWLIKDEGTMADFLDPDEDADLLASLVSLERYRDRGSRDAAAAQCSADARTPPTVGERAAVATRREELLAEAERLFRGAAELAAVRLTELALAEGLPTLKEPHLQAKLKEALKDCASTARPPPSVSPSLRHGLEPEWPRLGTFDISLRWAGVDVFGEVKCGEDELTLSACGWDAAKEAFCLQHGVGAGMLLVAAAPEGMWEAPGLGVELFSDHEWDMADIRTRYAAGFRKWEHDGYKPDYVFRRLRTFEVSRTDSFDVAGTDWLIRVARVEAVDGERMDWVPFLSQAG
jgi:hypothetical protein